MQKYLIETDNQRIHFILYCQIAVFLNIQIIHFHQLKLLIRILNYKTI